MYSNGLKWCGKCGKTRPADFFRCPICHQQLRHKQRDRKARVKAIIRNTQTQENLKKNKCHKIHH